MSLSITKYFSKYSLVLFVILTVLSTVSIVVADCYVIQNNCLDSRPSSCTDSALSSRSCIWLLDGSYSGSCDVSEPVDNDMTDQCRVGCCCSNTDVIGEQYTKGICLSTTARSFWEGSYDYSSCSAKCSNVASGTYSIDGTLRIGSNPASGITVWLDKESADVKSINTDGNGYFTFSGLNVGSHSLYATTNGGLCEVTKQVNLNSDTTQNLVLNCTTVYVSGQILSNGVRVTQATITMTHDGITETQTTSDGNYGFNVPAGSDVSIKAVSGEACSGSIGGTFNKDTTQDVSIRCSTYSVVVTVTDGMSGVGNASVVVAGQTKTTSGSGTASFSGISYSSSPYTITVSSSSGTSADNTKCHSTGSFTITDPNTLDYSATVNQGSDKCCHETVTTSGCVNRLQTTTTTYSGAGCDKEGTFASPASSCGKDPCVWSCGNWSKACDNGEIQKTRECILQNNGNCDTNIPTPDTSELCNPYCGNGVQNPNEACDYEQSTGNFYISPTCANSLKPYYPGITIQNANTLLPDGAFCNPIDCSCSVYTGPNIPPCAMNPGSIASTVTPVQKEPSFNIAWSMVGQSCGVFVDHFELEICNNKSGRCFDDSNYHSIDSNIGKDTFSFAHDGSTGNLNTLIEPETQYCYKVTAVFNETVPEESRVSSDVKCVFSGNESCLADHPSQWCIGNSIYSCNNSQNKLTLVKSCDVKTGKPQFCHNIGSNAQCGNQADCDSCNGILGIFGSQGFEIPVDADNTIICPSADNPIPDTSSNELGGCYLDYSKTSVDKTYSCSNVTSCYDYKSQNSCEEDYCGRFINDATGDNGCAWEPLIGFNANPLTINAFGKGVCIPRDILRQNCSLCNDISMKDSSKNRFGACSEDLCNLYGSCYYLKSSDKCMNVADVSCPTYKTVEECIGTIPNNYGFYPKNASTNTFWTFVVDDNRAKGVIDSVKSGGTNVLTKSNDGAGIGLCKWDGSQSGTTMRPRCFRDADNYINNSEQPTSKIIKDCRITGENAEYNNKMCERDNVPPNTVIHNDSWYGLYMDLKGKIDLTDRIRTYDNVTIWPIGDINSNPVGTASEMMTYYCINVSGPACYPNTSLIVNDVPSTKQTVGYDQPYIINLSKFGIGTSDDKKSFTMYYFSEDPAKNLELIKSFSFRVDTIPPDINLNISMDSYPTTSVWLTNFNVTIKLLSPDSNEPVKCSFKLTPLTDAAIASFNANQKALNNIPSYNNQRNIITTSSPLKTNYTKLIDGKYNYELVCTDRLGNPTVYSKDIVIDGDASINSPQPIGGTFRSNDAAHYDPATQTFSMFMSINTSANGTCKYTKALGSRVNIDSMTQFGSDNDQVKKMYHTTTVVLSPSDYSSNTYGISGIYRYDVACILDINDQSKVVYGTSSDSPYFAIDDIAPVTKLQYQSGSKSLDYTEDIANMKSGTFNLFCNDSSIYFTLNKKTNMAFGCNESGDYAYYCIEQPEGSTGGRETCSDISRYKAVKKGDSQSSIIFNYEDERSDDKARYGNDPTIHYYSKDNGGNVESIQTTKLRLRNTDFADPAVSVLYGANSETNTFDIEVEYLGESSVTINNFTVYRVVGSGTSQTLQEMQFSPSAPVSGSNAYKFVRSYLPNGNYRLIINATDDDGNIDGYLYPFTISGVTNHAYLISPQVGIGQSSGYNIVVNTVYPSYCKYSSVDYGASGICNKANKLDCLYSNENYALFNSENNAGLVHTLNYASSPDVTSGWLATPKISATPLYIICLVRDYPDLSDVSYANITVNSGYMTQGPAIDISYRTNPYLGPNASDQNVIINRNDVSARIIINTSQPSLCRINMTSSNSFISIDPSRNMSNGGTNNPYRYSDYRLGHNYTINYNGLNIFGGTFSYTINCTDLAQRSTISTATLTIAPDDSPPTATISETGEQLLTMKNFSVSCSDHCNDTYKYKVVNQGVDCAFTSSSGFNKVGYDNTIEIQGDNESTVDKKICVMVYDVLGRTATSELDVTIEPFNTGVLNVNYPYQYNDGSKFVLYSPTQKFDLNVTTAIPAECRYARKSSFTLPPALTSSKGDAKAQYIYSIGIPFTNTGDDSNAANSVMEHATSFSINTVQNTVEVFYIVCNTTGKYSTISPYVSREVYAYWDDSNPTINLTIPSSIYDWNNRTNITMKIITDDDTICIINDSRNILGPIGFNSSVYSNYTKSRSYIYALSNLLTMQEIDNLNTVKDMHFIVLCMNRARLTVLGSADTHYEMAKSVIVKRNSSDIFTTTTVPIIASTNIMSTCSVYVDGALSSSLSSSNRLYHTGSITVSSGSHNVDISCSVPENTAIATGHDSYTIYYDSENPTVVLSPVSGLEDLSTCNLETFSVNIDMSDDTGIVGYTYNVKGPGIVGDNTKYVESGNSGTITYTGTLVDKKGYTVTAAARDRAGKTSTDTITITANSPITGVACDSRPPVISSNIRYLGVNKNVAIVNISCTDSNDPTNSISASGCTNVFNYDFMEGQTSCSGAEYSASGSYNKLNIFFNRSGMLCLVGKDAAGYTTTQNISIDINPIYCGNGIIESKPSLADLGIPTSTTFNNWNANNYNKLADEECDGQSSIDSGSVNTTCLTEGFVGGDVTCSSTCRVDTSTCDDGMPVWIINPKPFGIGTSSSYTLTGGSGYDALCRYGLLIDTKNITKSYDAMNTNMSYDVNGVTHTTPIDGASDISRYLSNNEYRIRDIICKMRVIPSSIAKIEQAYGLVKVYEGYDASSPVINISTSKSEQGNRVDDYNDRQINIKVTTDDDTVCIINDTVSMFIGTLMDGSLTNFGSYKKLHQVTANYSNYNDQEKHDITYTVSCFNRAGLSSTSSILVHYDIVKDIMITKIAPVGDYTVSSTASYTIQTNILTDCVINNGTTTLNMSGKMNKQHYANIGVDDGWNTITVVCTDGILADKATAEYGIYGRATAPVNVQIATDTDTCSLSTINFDITATKTIADIASYHYSVSEVSTGYIEASGSDFDGSVSITPTGGLSSGHKYKIDAYAVDTMGQESSKGWIIVNAVSSNSSVCDYVAPTITISQIPTGYLDIAKANVTCSDTNGDLAGLGNSGCTASFNYVLVRSDFSCENITYSKTGSYGQLLTITNTSRLCVKGVDKNNNAAYAQSLFNLVDDNYINITPSSPLYVYPNVVVTNTPVTNIVIHTDVPASCRYSSNTNVSSTNLATAYLTLMNFDSTGTTSHTINSYNTYGDYENYLDVICYASGLSTNQYSRATIRVVYIAAGTVPALTLSLDPQEIVDWNSRHSELEAATSIETACSMTSTYGPHNGLTIGTVGDARTYNADHFLTLNFASDADTPRNHTYTVTCTNLAGQLKTSSINLNYNLATNLEVTLSSPAFLTKTAFDIIAATNINSTCRLYLDGADKGIMSRDATSRNHLKTVSGVANGEHIVIINCSTPIQNIRGSGTFTILVDTTASSNSTIGGPANTSISSDTTTCSLSTIDFDVTAVRTLKDIVAYNYTITDATAGVIVTSGYDTDGMVSVNLAMTEGHKYKIEAYATDSLGHISPKAWMLVSAAAATSAVCDYVAPTLAIVENPTGYADVTKASVSCSDNNGASTGAGNSGCTNTFNYRFIGTGASCENITYTQSSAYTQILTITNSSKLCVKGLDKNNNAGYSEIVFSLANNNYINIIPSSPLYVYPNTLVTTNPIFDAVLSTGVNADCRYSLTLPSSGSTPASLFESYIPFNITGGTTHTRLFFDTKELYEQYMDVVCNASLASNPFSRATIRIVYVNKVPSILLTTDPSMITDWNSRYSELEAVTSVETACSMTSTYGPHAGLTMGNMSDSRTYDTDHYLTLNYAVTTPSPSTFNYEVTCRNLAQQFNTSAFKIEYNLSGSLNIEIVSPTDYSSSTVEIIASTNLNATCSLTIDNTNKGTMSRDITSRNYLTKITGVTNGIHTVKISCSTLIQNLQGSRTFLINVNSVIPSDLLYCGDKKISGPNNENLFEQCDNTTMPTGVTCSSLGFKSGTLRCSGCMLDSSNCIDNSTTGTTDDPKCGNDVIETGETCELNRNYSNTKCTASGYSGGNVSCSGNCKLDYSQCYTIIPSSCGDGSVQQPNSAGKSEACDCGSGNGALGDSCTSTQLSGRSCSSFTGYNYIGGILKCTTACAFDYTSCDSGKGYCGNGKVDGPNSNNVYEQCDGDVPKGLSCKDYGFKSGGTLSCTNGCMINTSRCTDTSITGTTTNPFCGNRLFESGEQCEVGMNNTNMTCSMYGYDGGSITCNTATCKFAMSSCYFTADNNDDGGGSSSSSRCGDGDIDKPNHNGLYEQCDGSNIPSGLTCSDLGFRSGSVKCTSCLIDTSKCVDDTPNSTSNTCKNGKFEAGEVCDPSTDYNSAACSIFGYSGGMISCSNTCAYNLGNCYNTTVKNTTNTTTTTTKNICGDGTVDKPNYDGLYEQCDGTSVPSGFTCSSLGFKSGSVSCGKNCLINTSKCVQANGSITSTASAKCNNEILESGEQCELTVSNSVTRCSLFGYSGGNISCTNKCLFDLKSCYNTTATLLTCGDGKVSGPNNIGLFEQCDNSVTSGLTCKGFGFKNGSLSCSKGCLINTSKCIDNSNQTTLNPVCGNKNLESGEQCEPGMAFSNASNLKCTSFGYVSGDVSCSSKCTFNLSKCVQPAPSNNAATTLPAHCSNGAKDTGETDKDCGGECNACALNATCSTDKDCKSKNCVSKKCAPDPCSNGKLDAGEEDIDCGGNCDACPAPLSNPVKLPLMIIGIVSTLGGAGYIIYRTFIEKKPMGGARPPLGTGHGGPIQPMAPLGPVKLTPEQEEMMRKQREALMKKRQLRAKDRESVLKSLEDTQEAKNGSSAKSTTTNDANKKSSGEDDIKPLAYKGKSLDKQADSEGYVDLENLEKEKGKKATFDKLKEIGKDKKLLDLKGKKGKTTEKAVTQIQEPAKTDKTITAKEAVAKSEKSQEKPIGEADSKAIDTAKKISKVSGQADVNIKPKIAGNTPLTHKDALKLFGEMDKDKVMSKAFKDALSDLLESGKMDKDNVSKILFEYMDNGLLTKSDVAKISSELKII